jgi:glycerol transport system permease protein
MCGKTGEKAMPKAGAVCAGLLDPGFRAPRVQAMNGQPHATLILLLPALAVMAFSGLMPLGFAIYYSLHDAFAGNSFVWVGGQWYEQVLTSGEFWRTTGRTLGFTALVLAVEIPLGLWIAVRMPARGPVAAVLLVIFALPLLAPLLVVGYLWKVMTLPDTGLLSAAVAGLGGRLDMNDPVTTWAVLVAMDAWHWTGLVVLLCYAGLRAIPEPYYQAARVDGARGWAIFRHVELPRLRLVLLIAILLRGMDSFMIYTEPYVVSRGGPDVSTTFLSHELVQTALIQFDLGEGAAISVIYLSMVAAACWALFRLIVPGDAAARR